MDLKVLYGGRRSRLSPQAWREFRLSSQPSTSYYVHVVNLPGTLPQHRRQEWQTPFPVSSSPRTPSTSAAETCNHCIAASSKHQEPPHNHHVDMSPAIHPPNQAQSPRIPCWRNLINSARRHTVADSEPKCHAPMDQSSPSRKRRSRAGRNTPTCSLQREASCTGSCWIAIFIYSSHW